jgi:hypothetical protein
VNAVVDIHRARCDSPAGMPVDRMSFIILSLKRFGLSSRLSHKKTPLGAAHSWK